MVNYMKYKSNPDDQVPHARSDQARREAEMAEPKYDPMTQPYDEPSRHVDGDVLDRMRRLQAAWKDDPHGVGEAFGQAADEIERLRAVLHEIKRCNAQYNFGSKLVRLVDAALKG